MVTTKPCRTSALALCVLLWAMGCEKQEPPAPARPQFVQSDYAKNPDGPCERHPAEFYADKVKTKAGIEELIILSCQYGVRGDSVGLYYELFQVCGDCIVPTLFFDFSWNDIPFGTHQLSATYESDDAYGSSASPPLAQSILPALTLPTATLTGQSLVGVTGGSPNSWICTLTSAAWVPVGQVGAAAQSAAYSFPHGLFSYRLDHCGYTGTTFDVPPTVVQFLVLQLPTPLSPGTVFVNYGPTRANPSPHWCELPPKIDGASIRVELQDGYDGDDDLTQNLVIAGLGGPATPASAPKTTTVVEFYNAALDHYFMTAAPQEIADLDNNVHVGWVHTGASFKAYPTELSAAYPVCRFYLPPQNGDSHFYSASASECAETQQKFPSFIYESADVFHMALPDQATGTCASGTVPVYRVWNNRVSSNHRYTTSRTIRDQMVANGYIAEGYGPDMVIMCAGQ